jgi:hypothetical protein
VGVWTDRHDETNRRSSRLMQTRLKKSVSTGCMVVCDSNILTYLLTYSLTPCSRVLEKLTVPQLVKKFPAFYGTRRFITAFTSARNPSVS